MREPARVARYGARRHVQHDDDLPRLHAAGPRRHCRPGGIGRGFALGAANGYELDRRWTFRASGRVGRYVAVQAVGAAGSAAGVALARGDGLPGPPQSSWSCPRSPCHLRAGAHDRLRRGRVSTRAILTLGGIAVCSPSPRSAWLRCTGTRPRARPTNCAPMSPATTASPSRPARVRRRPHPAEAAHGGAARPRPARRGTCPPATCAYTGYSRLADAERVAVAYATASGSRPLWNVTDHIPGHAQDVAYLRAVIPAVVKAACADPGRVGVTGVSNGGGMSARMACDAADLVAAAAPVAGGYGALPDCHPSRPVPILEIHGTADQVVPYRREGEPGPRGCRVLPRAVAAARRLHRRAAGAQRRGRRPGAALGALRGRDGGRPRPGRGRRARLARRRRHQRWGRRSPRRGGRSTS